ncbi:MAG: helix-turn-helix transcriptional regulator [Bacteroidales bacterium]|nr:helix-turn-helix transcriptional regulator [Bacteroidales bacterium]
MIEIMKFNVEKLKELARPMNEKEQNAMNFRQENADWLRLSAEIALKIRKILRQKEISQVQFASKLGVTPAQVSKYLSGEVNFELKTISKLQSVLEENLIDVNLSNYTETSIEQRLTTHVVVMAYSNKSMPVRSYSKIGEELCFKNQKLIS